MVQTNLTNVPDIIGSLPYRMAFAGGWIDQPFISRHNPTPPGSMVVVSLVPTIRFMKRCGMGTSTRDIALKIWDGSIPNRDRGALVRELYAAENKGKIEPSGSQDMAGIVYPGINRLDYQFDYDDGYFPVHIESNNDPVVANWLENVIHMVPIAQRPAGYTPLGEKNLDAEWIRRLGQSGKNCFEAIINLDLHGLGSSMNECMSCWQAILPNTVHHVTINEDLTGILTYFQSKYIGAMYSGCGGGYLFVVSESEVPGSFQVSVRIEN